MVRRQQLEVLRQNAPLVLPSLLMCDFGDLRSEVQRLESAGVRGLHLDVMDGNFVPNLTYGMPIVSALRRLTDMPLDVHLMIANPAQYVEAFEQAGADVITVHIEAFRSARDCLDVVRKIRSLGVAAGVACNPATPLAVCEPVLSECDLFLVMSVPAGFGGQPFDESALEKLSVLRNRVPAGTLLEVDGGINSETIGRCAQAGAQLFVVGSAIFRSKDYGSAIESLSRLAMCEKVNN